MTIVSVVLQRLGLGVLTVLIVSILVFAGTEILPGDVAYAILGQGATPELVANIQERLGLDQPAYLRYLTWLGDLLRGDFGNSLANGADLNDVIGERIGNTVLLAAVTAIIAVPLSILLGLIASTRPNGSVDRLISTSTLALISVPDFLVAVLLVSLFAVELGWLPAIANMRRGRRVRRIRAGPGAAGDCLVVHGHGPYGAHDTQRRVERADFVADRNGDPEGRAQMAHHSGPCAAQRYRAHHQRRRFEPRLSDQRHCRHRDHVQLSRDSGN